MPRRKVTLPFGVTPLWRLSISDEQWKKLEKHYGHSIRPDLRSAIVAKTNTMRLRSDSRKSAPPLRKAIIRVAAIKRAAGDWLKWTDGLPPELEAMIMSVEEFERAERVIKPFMEGIVASCDKALPDLKSDLVSKEAQDARHPWEDWIVELTDLFDQYGLPTPARTDVDKNKTGPSPFVIFIRELQNLIDQKYWRKRSEQTLAKAINRARSPRKGEQTRQDE
jgi:hypothetical protein